MVARWMNWVLLSTDNTTLLIVHINDLDMKKVILGAIIFLIVASAFAPIGVNWLVSCPTPFGKDANQDSIWIGFWGNMISAVIAGIIPLVILYINYNQNEKQNQKLRELQVKTLLNNRKRGDWNRLRDMLNSFQDYVLSLKFVFLEDDTKEIWGRDADRIVYFSREFNMYFKDSEINRIETNLFLKFIQLQDLFYETYKVLSDAHSIIIGTYDDEILNRFLVATRDVDVDKNMKDIRQIVLWKAGAVQANALVTKNEYAKILEQIIVELMVAKRKEIDLEIDLNS